MHVLVILALAMAVGPGGATLRTGCYADSTVVGQVPEGSPVTVKFSLSGQSEPCYKVTTTIGGKTVEGYLPGTAISDLESFDQARKAGARYWGREMCSRRWESHRKGNGWGQDPCWSRLRD